MKFFSDNFKNKKRFINASVVHFYKMLDNLEDKNA